MAPTLTDRLAGPRTFYRARKSLAGPRRSTVAGDPGQVEVRPALQTSAFKGLACCTLTGNVESVMQLKEKEREFTPKGYWIGKTFISVSHYLLVFNTVSSPRKS